MTLAKYLWISGSAIIGLLGAAHLFYTFFSNKFLPRKAELAEEMKATSPVLTKQTTMWKAWMGFNASHSSGAIFIGVMNSYLAVEHFSALQGSNFFFLFNIITMGFYFWLAKRYWFKIPARGITLALICFIAAYVLTIINK
ncbi:MAG: hypothetical protein KF803_12180 [Cyclobacteriaceae bacterium]|nr:hypothetical protein [Cyclobacteriaceae bacterium]